MRADLACGEVCLGVTKYVACEDIDEAHNEDYDACCDDDAPEGKAEGFLGGGFFVHLPEDAVPEEDHGGAEHDEAGAV